MPSRPGHPGRWWSLTPPFHPYLRGLRPRGALLSVALCRRVAPPGRYPAPCSVELGLSSSGTHSRPSGLLGHQVTITHPRSHVKERDQEFWKSPLLTDLRFSAIIHNCCEYECLARRAIYCNLNAADYVSLIDYRHMSEKSSFRSKLNHFCGALLDTANSADK